VWLAHHPDALRDSIPMFCGNDKFGGWLSKYDKFNPPHMGIRTESRLELFIITENPVGAQCMHKENGFGLSKLNHKSNKTRNPRSTNETKGTGNTVWKQPERHQAAKPGSRFSRHSRSRRNFTC
jgi:hypothetical protein